VIRNASLEPSNALNGIRQVECRVLDRKFFDGTVNRRRNFLKERVTDMVGEAVKARLRRCVKIKYIGKKKRTNSGVQHLVQCGFDDARGVESPDGKKILERFLCQLSLTKKSGFAWKGRWHFVDSMRSTHKKKGKIECV
jgi:hypothetical protein